MTDARVTQVGAEQWIAPAANAQVSQAAVEQWASVSSAGNRAIMSQMALEQWALVDSAITSTTGSGGAFVVVMA